MPEKSLVLDLPDVVQPNDYWCWPSCAYAIGQYYGVGHKELSEWAKALHTTKKLSTSPETVAEYFRDEFGCAVEYRQYMEIDDLRKYTEKQWPVLVAVQEYMNASGVKASGDYGHCLCVLAVGDGFVIAQDPSEDNVLRPKSGTINAPGRVVITEKTFLDNWKDRDYYHLGIAIGPPEEEIKKEAEKEEKKPLENSDPAKPNYEAEKMSGRLSGEQLKFAAGDFHDNKLAKEFESQGLPATARMVRVSHNDPDDAEASVRSHRHDLYEHKKAMILVKPQSAGKYYVHAHLYWPVGEKPFSSFSVSNRNNEYLFGHTTHNLNGLHDVLREHGATEDELGPLNEMIPEEPDWRPNQLMPEDYYAMSRLSSAQLQFARDPNKPRKFASTQFNLPEDLASKLQAIAAKIPDKDLADDGRDDEPHCTLLWGLADSDVDKIKELAAGFGPVKIKLGKISLFHNKEKKYDVVKVDVESKDLHRLNKLIADNIEHESTFPDYKPHCTLAMVKLWEGDSLVGQEVGGEFEASEFLFCPKDQSAKIKISLGGKKDKPAKMSGRLSVEQMKFAQAPVPEPLQPQVADMHTMFRNAIEANRNDSGVKAAYADWLSEQGLSATAELMMKHLNKADPQAERENKQMCQCGDPGCPCCHGRCEQDAAHILHRVDMEDETGTPMCEGCADDAGESGLFEYAQSRSRYLGSYHGHEHTPLNVTSNIWWHVGQKPVAEIHLGHATQKQPPIGLLIHRTHDMDLARRVMLEHKAAPLYGDDPLKLAPQTREQPGRLSRAQLEFSRALAKIGSKLSPEQAEFAKKS